MRAHRRLWLLCLLCVQACTCNPGGYVGVRSGDARDDDVEEPLPSPVKKYEPLLLAANTMTGLLRDGKLREFYDGYVDPSLQAELKLADLEKMQADLRAHLGAPVSFKPRQWAFRSQTNAVASYVQSQKIVRHERGSVYYAYTFADEHARKIIGLFFRARPPRGPYRP